MALPIVASSFPTFPITVAQGGTSATDAATARQNLGLVIGTDVLAPNGSGSSLTGVALLASANTFTLAQTITDATASSSSLTGALIVTGGIGVGKDSWINGVRIGRGLGNIASNTAGGVNALNSNVTGANDSAFGNSAASAYTASGGAFFGTSAGQLSSTGDGITALGSLALHLATTHARTVGIGYQAGRLQNDGTTSLTLTGDGNIFIGALTKGFANSQANAITIGDGALSEGSNKTVIGNITTASVNIWGLGVSRGLLWGLTLSNNVADATNDIDIAVGECRDSTGVRSIVGAAMTKRLDANWAVGSAAGFRNSAIAIADTTYHIYVVAKADGTQDYYAHTSTTVATVITALQAESGGTLYVYARRIGSIVRAGGIIIPFTQDGDYFSYVTPVLDVSDTTLTTSRKTYTLASVPTGLRMLVQMRLLFTHVTAGAIAIFGDLNEADAAPSLTIAPLHTHYVHNSLQKIPRTMDIFVNTSAQIFGRAGNAASSTSVLITPLWWKDTRGRDN